MADVIGPSQYSQMLGAEKTPEEQGVLAGDVNWSGTQGGGADVQLAPGGEFGQQAQMDTEGFNKILAFAGSKVKQKVDEASYKAYWEGVHKAANGEAAENLHTQKVKTGIWEKLVPDKVMEAGYNDYMAFTNMTKVQSEFMKDMEAWAEKDPAEVQKAWVNAVSGSLTGNKQQDERILELSTPLGGEVFKQAAFKRQEYLKAQETNARTAASISTAEQVKALYKNINPENAQETIVQANAIMGGAFEKQDNETYAEHQTRIAATIDGYAESGSPAIFNYYKQNGMLKQMSTANQVAFAKAEDSANTKAGIDYIKSNPNGTAELEFALKSAATQEEQDKIIDEYNAEYQAKTGATEPLYDKAQYFLQNRLNIAERKSEQIAVQNANAQ